MDAALGGRHSSLPNTFVVVIVDGAEQRGIYSIFQDPRGRNMTNTSGGDSGTREYDFDAMATILIPFHHSVWDQ